MDKDDIVKALAEIADLLEIVEVGRFEIMAFRNAGSALDEWEGDLSETIAGDKLSEIPTVGKGTAKVIAELFETGGSKDLDDVRAQVPDDLPKLLRFRGLGPKRVRSLWQELGVTGPGDLKEAIDEGRVAKLKGFGAKTIETMLASIEYFNNSSAAVKPELDLTKVPQSVASSGRILAGTSGYSYPAWKGSFFPPKAKTGDLLKHYAEKLSSVEINNTFYRFPAEKVVEQWKLQTPDNFKFALKAHRRITHQMRLSEDTRIRIEEFVARCSVLQSRLGCILFQLPPDFKRDDEKLHNLLSSIPDGPRYAIEFRHSSWLHDQVYEQLTEKNVACVAGDSDNSSPFQIATADFVYCRLRKPFYTANELDLWNQWFIEQQSAGRDVLVYLKHDDTGDAATAAIDIGV